MSWLMWLLLSMFPCQFEDGPGPCYWDAEHQGNGVGTSVWIDITGEVHS
jgi:hypothetical protein